MSWYNMTPSPSTSHDPETILIQSTSHQMNPASRRIPTMGTMQNKPMPAQTPPASSSSIIMAPMKPHIQQQKQRKGMIVVMKILSKPMMMKLEFPPLR